MKIKLLSTILCCTFLLICSLAQAQGGGTLHGKVYSSDGQPAEGVSVVLVGKKHATTTNTLGEYKITGIAPGNYILRVSSVELKPVEKEISIKENEVAEYDFRLTENHAFLEEIVIAGRKNKFYSKESQSVAKMPLSRLENPQVYTSIPKNLLREQMVIDFGSALRNAPGLYKIQGSRGINSDGASFYSLRGFRTEASMVDGVPGQTNGDYDPASIERIEVLKGPSATLFGGAVTSFGGMVNIITKKPLDTLGGEVSYTTGSFNLNRVMADIYGPLNKEKTVLFRLNASYHHQLSWQDAGFKKTMFLAPSLELRASERLKINLNADFYSAEATSPSAVFLNRTRPFVAHEPGELNFDWKRSYTSNDLTMKTPTVNVRAVGTYKLSENWTSQTVISSNTRKSDGYYQYQFIRKATDDSLERNVSLQNTINTALDIQQNFTGNFKIAGFKNRLLVGIDYLRLKVNNDNSPYIVYDFVNGTLNDDKNYTKISKYGVDQKIMASTAAPTRNHGSTYIYSAYASDVVNLTPNLLAMLSLRVDRFDSKGTINHATNAVMANSNYQQTAFSPKFGLVYEVIKKQVSVFGNYMNGFSNVAPVTQPIPELSGNFKPQQANQFEGGVKLELFNNQLNFTASYYDIKVDNITRPDVYKQNGVDYNVTVQDGTQTSKGIEFELNANPLPGLNINGGYAHNNSKLTKTTAALQDRRPAAAGPADLANLWVSYSILKGDFKGLGMGAGGTYTGKHMTANSATTGVFTFDSYTLLNATVFYETRRFRLGVKFDNITDEQYFLGQGTITPQMPMNVLANVAVKL
ncbi:TonB-dependent siderophore receptor [Paraflavitalea soli]|uniref:TonB-dependent siderophore receptor n=1 Tax=Paraflavitalea soli TaxID=2315862 RepID=A0A3B7MS13_9BACT|nr:TonB-dependent receptor [Paraflavitalea soli]AXY77324.1 TonB-dependent siderophore receptor [Paraflavitalea soli]